MQGLDQEMPGSLFLSTLVLNRSVHGYTKVIPPPVNQTLHFPPTVTMARIDQAVTRVLEPMFRMGLFDSEGQFLPLNTTAKNVTSAAHNLVARKLARAGMGERDRSIFLAGLLLKPMSLCRSALEE